MRAYLAILLVAPGALAAQEYTLAPYAAQNRSLPGTPALFGASLARYRSVIGMRVGGAAGPTLTPLALGTDGRATAWTADADVVLDAGRFPIIGALLAGFVPTVFAGVGAEGLAAASGDVWAPVTSYGVLVNRPIFAGFAVETEARHRTPARLDSRSLPEGFQRGWEYRVGFSLRFGGRGGAGTPSRWPSSSRAPAPVPTSPTGGRPSAPASASAARVLSTADRYLGVRYVYGGSTPSGFDCSGFVQYVFRQHGVTLPRTSRQQATVGARAAAEVGALRPGDLMLFASRGSRIDHVAIYAGHHRIIHSTSSGGGVRYDDLRSDRGRWFVAHHVASRRVLDDGRSLVRALDAAALAPAPLDPPDPAPKPRR